MSSLAKDASVTTAETPALIVPTPRVNGSKLSLHINQVVRLVGLVSHIKDQQVDLVASDGKHVNVRLSSGTALTQGQIVEVIGNVESVSQVLEYSTYVWENVDLDIYDKMINLTYQYAELFT
ncbi:uncharacterized protein LOC126316802 [Schistocerca gregaria]|uniref:uncharacterized protein LOC126316802 n=1 Tax=Schistocerca gregaria TaxID=7010 RepID=UPI00211F0D36|nr:uncharacterized protein LOC126316802 [Schistocerca gregaria]